MTPSGPFTMLPHKIVDSTAARLLSPGAFASLIDFLVLWGEHSYRKPTATAMPFTWTGCKRIVSRETFSKNRAELVAKGFIASVSDKIGTYRPSDAWTAYTPTGSEIAALRQHEQKQADRLATTKDHRVGKSGPVANDVPALVVSENPALSTGLKKPTLVTGSEKSTPLKIERNKDISIQPPPLTPPTGAGSCVARSGGAGLDSQAEPSRPTPSRPPAPPVDYDQRRTSWFEPLQREPAAIGDVLQSMLADLTRPGPPGTIGGARHRH